MTCVVSITVELFARLRGLNSVSLHFWQIIELALNQLAIAIARRCDNGTYLLPHVAI